MEITSELIRTAGLGCSLRPVASEARDSLEGVRYAKAAHEVLATHDESHEKAGRLSYLCVTARPKGVEEDEVIHDVTILQPAASDGGRVFQLLLLRKLCFFPGDVRRVLYRHLSSAKEESARGCLIHAACAKILYATASMKESRAGVKGRAPLRWEGWKKL